MKEKASKEQNKFNELHGVTPKKIKRRKSTFVQERPEISDDEKEEEEVIPPKSKKRKVSVSSNLESDSDERNTKQIQFKLPTKQKSNGISPAPSPIKTTQSPAKAFQSPSKVPQSPSKTVTDKIKKRLYSDSSVASERETVNSKSESDAAQSSGSTSDKKSVKKKLKKEKKSKIVEPPGDKPPSTLFKYFADQIHTGKPSKAAKAFDKLPKKERKHLNSEYNEKVEAYVAQLKIYLGSLSKEDAIDYVSSS